MKRFTSVLLLLLAGLSLPLAAQNIDTSFYGLLKFRNIGPWRGGRSAAVCGVVGNEQTFYFGATGGGVWKTRDGGYSWQNISDGFFGGSIGAIAVASSDPNVVYVGGGEHTVRGNVSHGHGLWKSEDAGKTWKSLGFADSRHITKILVHPKNHDLIYIGVLGHLFGPNEERGVYKSTDGGKTFSKVLFVNKEVGIADMCMDPNNPRVLYASAWRVKRTPYSLESGGEGSGLWKSTDEGLTWKDISKNEGMPKGTLGMIGISCVGDKVWAMVEAAEGGLYSSNDAGKTFYRASDNNNFRQRAWYFSHIAVHPKEPRKVYILNVNMYLFTEGSGTNQLISTPHGDHHDLWIDPEKPTRMIVGDDGGAQVTFDAGAHWSTYHNQPTAQLYRLSTDNDFPYRILAAQQDNSALRIPHRTKSWGGISEKDWDETAGGESGYIVADPLNPDVVYGGSYGGYFTRYNHKTEEFRNINIWPDNPMGHGAGANKYRFQWNFPVFFSPHNPKCLYAAANVLFKSLDEGQSWTPISPDLTRNDSLKMLSSGGPITKDNTCVEYYCTIFAAAESNLEKDVLWVGSDDGLLHVSRDGGKSWQNVTPPAKLLPEWTMINCIEVSPHEKGAVYVAATAYKLDDFKPYLLKSKDYGKTWERIDAGIAKEHFTRTIRADKARRGMLFAGTEAGLYVSFNDGKSWQAFQMNLPIVPVTDLHIKDDDLIVATQGRSIWILDDLSTLQQVKEEYLNQKLHVFKPRAAYRGFGAGGGRESGQNPTSGFLVNYYLKDTVGLDTLLKIEVCDKSGKLIKRYSPKMDEKAAKKDKRLQKLKYRKGLNTFEWDMHHPDAISFEGIVMWSGGTRGPAVAPGVYQFKFFLGKDSMVVEGTVKKDPRSKSTEEDLRAQEQFLLEVNAKLSEVHQSIIEIRKYRGQINGWKERFDPKLHKALISQADSLNKAFTKVEETLYQTKSKSGQDPINFPIRLNDKLSGVASAANSGDWRPTAATYEVKKELTAKIDEQLAIFKELKTKGLKELNKAIAEAGISAIGD